MILALLLALPARALDFDGGSNPGDLATTPTAAIVLGFSPDDVQLPGTPSEIVADLGTAISDADGVPDSFALEISPFWLGTKGSAALDLRQYVAGGPATLKRNFTVSAAVDRTSTSFGGEDSDLRAALAVRTTLWGKPGEGTDHAAFAQSWDALFPADGSTPAARPALDDRDACANSVAMLAEFSAWLNQKVSAELKALQSEHLKRATAKGMELAALCGNLDPGSYPGSVKACEEAGFAGGAASASPVVGDESKTLAKVRAIADELAEAEGKAAADVDALVKAAIGAAKKDPNALGGELATYMDAVGFEDAFAECGELLDRRQGFVMDIAAGGGITSFDDTLSQTYGSDFAAWMAPGWVARKWSLTGLARVRGFELYDTPLLSLDLGAGFGYSWDGLTLGVQGRYGVPLNHDTPDARALLTADVRVNKSVWFAAGLGAGFPPDEPESLLSFLGIKFAAEGKATLSTPTPGAMAGLLAE